MKRKFCTFTLACVLLLSCFSCVSCSSGDSGYLVDPNLNVFYDDSGKAYVAEKDKTATLELTKNAKVAEYRQRAVATDGSAVQDPASIALFDEETMTVTAAGNGTLYIDLCDEEGNVLETATVTSQGAYPADPKLTSIRDNGINGSHDPSLVEYDGYYYVFTTGWSTGGNQIRRSSDLIHWTYYGTTFNGFSGESPSGKSWDEEFADILTALDCPTISKASFWAPDIVECPDGKGFWLYTCAVYTEDAGQTDGYDRAAIFLCYSEDLTPGSFEYKGIIFQSCLPVNGSAANGMINAIDPQIIFTPNGKMYMAYGSFHDGLYIHEMNTKTGLKSVGMNKVYTDEEVTALHDEHRMEGTDGAKYCGTQIASGAMEAPVIARHDDVPVYNDDGTLKETVETRYFLMSSYGLLASSYNMRYALSDGAVKGPYLDAYGEELESSGDGSSGTGYKAMGAYQFVYSDGTAMEANAGRNTMEYNVYAPGHNDLYTTQSGINVVSRINRYYQTDMGGDFALFINQYYLNSLGQIVINPNRYAGERLRTVTAKEFAELTGGKYQFVLMQDGVSTPLTSTAAAFTYDGADGGSFTYTSGGETYNGTWSIFGDYYMKLETDYDTYYCVVTPAYLEGVGGGLSVTGMGMYEGMAVYLNSDPT